MSLYMDKYWLDNYETCFLKPKNTNEISPYNSDWKIRPRGEEVKNMSWKFEVLAPNLQIDFDEIRKDLTVANPIALVEFKKEYLKEEQKKIDECERIQKRLKVVNARIKVVNDQISKLEEEGVLSFTGEDKFDELIAERELLKDNEKLFKEVEELKAKSWMGYVVIHNSLIKKAQCLEIPSPRGRYCTTEDVLFQKEFSKWIDWAKKVKNAKWPENEKNKGEVTVQLVKV